MHRFLHNKARIQLTLAVLEVFSQQIPESSTLTVSCRDGHCYFNECWPCGSVLYQPGRRWYVVDRGRVTHDPRCVAVMLHYEPSSVVYHRRSSADANIPVRIMW